jgi:phosphatidylserine decarboxylase
MKFRIHKEGERLLTIAGIAALSVCLVVSQVLPSLFVPIAIIALVLFGLVLQFFRNPIREISVADDGIIYAPADGKVVVIEETDEPEYFHDRRIQVSIFMNPINVHVNRNPISGLVKYYRYHPGKYLVAWHPKSSTENERTTVVLENKAGKQILLRQIAGAMAKRIINYLQEGDTAIQGKDMGFIRFGSRVDMFLPLDAKIEVVMNQVSVGNKTIIARI